MILLGLDAGALGGYSGTDPALDGPGSRAWWRAGEARYVLLGGEYSLRGGNRATRGRAASLQGAGAVGMAQPGRLPVRPRAVRLRRARTRALRRAQPALERPLRPRPTARGGKRARTARVSRRGGPARHGRLAVGDQRAARPHRRRRRSPFSSAMSYAAHELVARALEVLGQAQQHRAAVQARRVARPEQRRQRPRARACPCGGSGRPGR